MAPAAGEFIARCWEEIYACGRWDGNNAGEKRGKQYDWGEELHYLVCVARFECWFGRDLRGRIGD
jgi:hypothetical protein